MKLVVLLHFVYTLLFNFLLLLELLLTDLSSQGPESVLQQHPCFKQHMI